MECKKRLIDADAVRNALYDEDAITMKGVAIINQFPTVDAVEVVHGEWSTIEDDLCGLVALHCSVCNQEWWFEDDAPIKHYHYCPNCSAKMDGGNDNERC